jgi:hypothetical protein
VVKAGKLTEKQFQKQVIDLARLFGWKVAHFRPAMVTRGGKVKYETPVGADGKGWPDLVLVHRRRRLVLFVELKVGKNTTTPEQEAWLDDLFECGQLVTDWRPEQWPDIEAMLAGRDS